MSKKELKFKNYSGTVIVQGNGVVLSDNTIFCLFVAPTYGATKITISNDSVVAYGGLRKRVIRGYAPIKTDDILAAVLTAVKKVVAEKKQLKNFYKQLKGKLPR